MLLCVPIVGNNQTVYGVCGVEVSALYFQLSCPATTGQFGSTVTVLAPVQDNRLVLSQGMVGGVSGTYLEGQETFSIHQGRYFNTYLSESGQYIGLQTPISISKEDAQELQWAVAILLPQESYAAHSANLCQTWIIAVLVLLLALLLIAFFPGGLPGLSSVLSASSSRGRLRRAQSSPASQRWTIWHSS